MSPDIVMRKPRFVRIFMLKSMEIQVEAEAREAEAARQRREQMMQQQALRRRRR